MDTYVENYQRGFGWTCGFLKKQIFADAGFWIKMWIFADVDDAFTLDMRMLKNSTNADVAFTKKMWMQILKNCKCGYRCRF